MRVEDYQVGIGQLLALGLQPQEAYTLTCNKSTVGWVSLFQTDSALALRTLPADVLKALASISTHLHEGDRLPVPVSGFAKYKAQSLRSRADMVEQAAQLNTVAHAFHIAHKVKPNKATEAKPISDLPPEIRGLVEALVAQGAEIHIVKIGE